MNEENFKHLRSELGSLSSFWEHHHNVFDFLSYSFFVHGHGADGVYLIEADRVLRPGGYWVLSGSPINWKNHWRGWERTQEDLRAEQERKLLRK